MGILKQQAVLFCAASILVGVLMGVGSSLPAVAADESGVTWDIHSKSEDRQTGNGEDWTETTEQHASDGQEITDEQTRHVNEDGSSTEHEEVHYADGKGKEGSYSQDTETDAQGNRKVHYEETQQENGKCEKYVRDEVYDRNNKLISSAEKTLPCGDNYSLEITMDGTLDMDEEHVRFGPNKATIPLERDGDTYRGSYSGQFIATGTGVCSLQANYPVTFAVTAKESGSANLDFTMENSIGMSALVVCNGGSGAPQSPPMKGPPWVFTLPARDGASDSRGTGTPLSVVITLRERH